MYCVFLLRYNFSNDIIYMFYKNNDIDERKNMLYKKMMNEVSQKRDEKALKKQAAKEVDLLKKCLFIKKEPKNEIKNVNIIDELLLFVKKNN